MTSSSSSENSTLTVMATTVKLTSKSKEYLASKCLLVLCISKSFPPVSQCIVQPNQCFANFITQTLQNYAPSQQVIKI